MKNPSGSIVFLEPSCGDGRILRELLQTTKDFVGSNAAYVGIEIDPNAIEKSKQKLNGSKVTLKCADYLSLLNREQLSPECTDSSTLIALGGPPYSPHHLPERFILHSIIHMRAAIVVFILPQRLSRDAEKIQKILNNHDISERWSFDNNYLENISFSFGEDTVPQPSILQSWYKLPQIL
jgi:hypothetical protein